VDRKVFDRALVGLLLVGTQCEAWLGPYDDRLVLGLLTAVMAVALLWRRTHPWPATAAVATAYLLAQVATGAVTEMATGTLPLLITSYSAAAYLRTRPALGAGLTALVAAELSVLPDPSPSSFAYAALVVGVAWTVGRVLATRHQQVGELEVQAEQLRRQNEQEAREAVAAERARIARELHDVVAHGVSVIVVQAGAAEGVVHSRPDDAAAAMREIQKAGRQALVELRQMLDLLRSSEDDGAGQLHPQPGLADIADLLESARSAGLHTSLQVSDLPDRVPPAVGLSAFRIVQEALTNTLKHAQADRVVVRLTGVDGALEVHVQDTGRGLADIGGHGHGLVGMRERVALFGGSLDVTSKPGGGFAVRARIPVDIPT
jgi:signal transduction histidine kinase